MRRRQLNVLLPTDWREVVGQGGGRCYRRNGSASGWLRISLLPPAQDLQGHDTETSARLQLLLDDMRVELGRMVHVGSADCALGRMSFSLWKSPQHGLCHFWLIPSEVLVFASYTMENLRTVQQEIADAHAIMSSVTFVDGDPA